MARSSGHSDSPDSESGDPAATQAASASTNDRQSGHRWEGCLAIARATTGRSGSGSVERSGSPNRWPIMTDAGGPTNGSRPPRSWQNVTASEYWSEPAVTWRRNVSGAA